MNLSAPFIKRPIATTLLAIGLAIAGIVAFNLLPVAELPQIDFPTINVQASLPGASAEVMAAAVATPLERQLGRIAGITDMTSYSMLGTTGITIQFDLSRDINGAARDVQAAINAARSQLPTDLPRNPTYRKANPSDAPIMILALTSDVYSTGQMYDAASTILQQRLSQIDGVGQVNVGGGALPAVRVELNPTALNSYGIGLNDVRTVIAAQNANKPKGQLSNSTLSTNDTLFQADEYKPLIIAYRNGNAVRLSDVAQVTDSVENIRNAGLVNGKPCIVLVIFKEPGANVVKTVDHVKALLPTLQAALPAQMRMTLVMDRTTTIRASLHDIEITLIIAVLLVILVVYLFLRNVRAMLIPSVAIPLSILGTFGVLWLLGYSLNNLSLMALTISTGFVVDDAVVVLENITRHLEQGLAPLRAALLGVKEVGFTVLAMSISLIAVFIPILLMGGIVGRLFREFAVTLSVAVVISLLVSLTVTPMMCAKLLKRHPHPPFGHPLPPAGEGNNVFKNFYQKTLQWALNHPRFMLLTTAAAVLLNIGLFIVIPKGFFPQQDTGRITGSIVAAQNISFQAMREKLNAFVHIIQQDPATQNVVGYVGGGTTNTGFIFIALKPLSERKVSADDIINRLRSKLATIPGAALYLQAAQDIKAGGHQNNSQFQYTITADNLADLNIWTPRIMQRLEHLPGIADVNSDQQNQGLQEYIHINHDAAARFGITTQQIDRTLYDAFGQAQISTLYKAKNQYHVVMEVAPPYWQSPETLKDIYVLSPTNKEVSLSAFADFAPSNNLLSVNHQGQAPAATLSFNLLPGEALGDAVKEVTNTVADMHLPETVQASFRGTAQAFQSSLEDEPYLILAAIITVYIVLGVLYESALHPLTILSTLPSAGIGALLALLITGTNLDIIGLIGIILLIGIVKKNAIMMIDFAINAQRAEKKSAQEAIYQAALLRFRPIMMTTAAALLGALPLAFSFGIGAELRRPLGIAIIGGLIVSQLLTLYTTPVIYLALERFKKHDKK